MKGALTRLDRFFCGSGTNSVVLCGVLLKWTFCRDILDVNTRGPVFAILCSWLSGC